MTQKHTPGPWFLGTYTDHKPDADRGDWCGEIYSKEGKIYHGPFSFQSVPIEANARLMAAAPEMFDELHHVADWLHGEIQEMTCDAGNFDGGSVANCEHCQMIGWINRIDAILARAGGA